MPVMSKEEFVSSFIRDRGLTAEPPPERKREDAGEMKGQRAKRTVWTNEMCAELSRMHAEKLSPLEIAERLGLDELAVRNKITRMGLREPRKSVAPKGEKKESADAIYIRQLEDLLKERTLELEKAQAYNEALRIRNEMLMEQAEERLKDEPNFSAWEEVYALADCLGSINFNDLMKPDSASYLTCAILDIADRELAKECKMQSEKCKMNADEAEQ